MSTNITSPPKLSKSGTRRTNALPSGYLLDEYRIETILGAGGFGVTYKALDTHLNTWVALKEYFPIEWSFRDADGITVHPNTQGLSSVAGEEISDYEWGLERFLDEARVLARIQHPYVVRVKRYFRANGTAYIVMEYEEGEPLSTVLDQHETLSENEVRGLLEDVLPALQAVHAQGYLHRDIKPANLYVRSRDQRIMLIDFGAARAAIGRHSRNVTSLVTPGYSPPEQYTTRNDRYGTWTDLYALGAVLYRCVTGRTPAEAAERLLDDNLEPAVVAGAGRYSANLLRVIDRALAVRPEMRFRDVTEMQAALIGTRDEDDDETVIMAPVFRTRKPAGESVSLPLPPQPTTEPVVDMDVDGKWAETVRPLADSHQPATRRRELVPVPAASVGPSPRRVPVVFLAGGVLAVALVVLVVAWLWPSPPTEPLWSNDGLAPHGPLVQPSGDHLPPATGTPGVEPAAPAESSVPPPGVETVAREPAPAAETGLPMPAGQQPAPGLEPEGRTAEPIFEEEPTTAQPVQFHEVPITESAPETAPAPVMEGTATPSPPALTPAPGRVRPPSSTAPARQTASRPDVERPSPTRKTEPARSRPVRQKGRRGRASPESPVVATPAAPVRGEKTPRRVTNPWESPTSAGFNQR